VYEAARHDRTADTVLAVAGASDDPVDHVLTTTRAVRRRLDLDRPVDPALVRECLTIALQAPTGGNNQGWHFVVVTEPSTRQAIAEVFRRGAIAYAQRRDKPRGPRRARTEPDQAARRRVMDSAGYLFEHLHRVPVLVIPCLEGRADAGTLVDQATAFGSILPAVWSFMLAARARGLGTSWTTVHLEAEEETAALLGIPWPEVTQVALVPVAHTVGADFQPAPRRGLDEVLHWDRW
jgi:nitroreductase